MGFIRPFALPATYQVLEISAKGLNKVHTITGSWAESDQKLDNRGFAIHPIEHSEFLSGKVTVSLSTVDFLRLLKRIELTFPEATPSLVNAVRLATRRTMRNGAMICSSARLDYNVLRLRCAENMLKTIRTWVAARIGKIGSWRGLLGPQTPINSRKVTA